MHKSLLFAALLATTALTPARAEAGPVLLFAKGVAAAFSAYGAYGAAIGASLGGAAAAGVAFGTFLSGSVIGKTLLALGASALISALTPQPRMPTPSEQFNTFSQPLSYHERVYGTVKKGGVMGFRSGIVDHKRHWTVTLAAHPTEGPVAHWLDLREVETDGGGAVLTEPLNNHMSIRTYTGSGGQAADPELLTQFDQITPAHDFAGHSYAALWAKKPPQDKALEIYTQGREPSYAPVWRGWNEVFDPRTGVYGWSDNWALIFAHELSVVWGLPVDWVRVAEEANICDEVVTDRDGHSRARYTYNHALTSDQSFADALATFLGAVNGMVWQRTDGVVDFYAGRWMEPELTLTADSLFSLSFTDGDYGLSPVTEYVINYREPKNGYVETPSAGFVLDAQAAQNTQELAIYSIDSHNQALRVAKPLGLARRARRKVKAAIGLALYEVIGGRGTGLAHRFVNLAHPMLGPDPVAFEVSALRMGTQGGAGEIELIESAASYWSFDAATEEPEPPAYNSDEVSEDDPVDPVTGLTGVVVDGTGGVAQIKWAWDAVDESLSPVLRIRQSGEAWSEVVLTSGAVEHIQSGLIDGATYEAQIRARTSGYRVGQWSDQVSVQAVANTAAPDAHSSFALSVSGGDVTVSFTAGSLGPYQLTRILRADYAAGYSGPFDIADAAFVQAEHGLPGAVDQWVDTAPAVGVHAYWLIPVNASGVVGPVSGPETIETF
ncbi:MAG: hypothetical protein JXQ89_17390 [Pelagimonas sp.]